MNPKTFMSTPTSSNEYLLLIRGTHWDHGLSAADMQRIMSEFNDWAGSLAQSGVLRGAQPLRDEGKIVARAGGASVTDGAFAESKEAIGGYFLLAVPTMDEAVRRAQTCPILAYGAEIEVRPVAGVCRQMAAVQAQSASASA